jgi:hypothetical protein
MFVNKLLSAADIYSFPKSYYAQFFYQIRLLKRLFSFVYVRRSRFTFIALSSVVSVLIHSCLQRFKHLIICLHRWVPGLFTN